MRIETKKKTSRNALQALIERLQKGTRSYMKGNKKKDLINEVEEIENGTHLQKKNRKIERNDLHTNARVTVARNYMGKLTRKCE